MQACIVRSIATRDKLYASLKKMSVTSAEYPALTINLKVFKKILKHSIKDAKKSYYCEHFQKYKLDLKKDIRNYQTNTEQRSRISHIQGFHIKKFKNEKCIADAFNQYFTNIGPNLAAKIMAPQNISYKSHLKRNIDHVFQFKTLT